MNAASVARSLKDLETRGFIKKMESGFILLAEKLVPGDDDDDDDDGKESMLVEKQDVDEYKPRFLFDGCYDLNACIARLREEGSVCLADIRHSYHEIPLSAQHSDDIYKILVRLEDRCKEENRTDTYKFPFNK
jgi:hypothetical protein